MRPVRFSGQPDPGQDPGGVGEEDRGEQPASLAMLPGAGRVRKATLLCSHRLPLLIAGNTMQQRGTTSTGPRPPAARQLLGGE